MKKMMKRQSQKLKEKNHSDFHRNRNFIMNKTKRLSLSAASGRLLMNKKNTKTKKEEKDQKVETSSSPSSPFLNHSNNNSNNDSQTNRLLSEVMNEFTDPSVEVLNYYGKDKMNGIFNHSKSSIIIHNKPNNLNTKKTSLYFGKNTISRLDDNTPKPTSISMESSQSSSKSSKESPIQKISIQRILYEDFKHRDKPIIGHDPLWSHLTTEKNEFINEKKLNFRKTAEILSKSKAREGQEQQIKSKMRSNRIEQLKLVAKERYDLDSTAIKSVLYQSYQSEIKDVKFHVMTTFSSPWANSCSYHLLNLVKSLRKFYSHLIIDNDDDDDDDDDEQQIQLSENLSHDIDISTITPERSQGESKRRRLDIIKNENGTDIFEDQPFSLITNEQFSEEEFKLPRDY